MRYHQIYATLPEINIKLTHSEEKARKFIEELCGSARKWDKLQDSFDATTSWLIDPLNGENVWLVYFKPNLEFTAAQDAALLAHEAVHIKQDYVQMLGERRPGNEIEAYIVQAITNYLVDKHFRWKRRKLEQE